MCERDICIFPQKYSKKYGQAQWIIIIIYVETFCGKKISASYLSYIYVILLIP